MDIFPLDSCFPDNCKKDRELAIPFMKQCGAHMKYESSTLSKEQSDEFKSLLVHDPIKSYENVQRIMMNSEYSNSEYWWISTINIYSPEKLTWRKSCFSKTEKHKFEMIEVAIPSGWDDVLKIQFDDYLLMPPVNKRGHWHDGFIFDTDVPYIEYSKQLIKK